mmetsp:Transcript_9928/g.14527  ORF Transcript_9928/g.14527 Transcript_9928/m.14527 type:complete len:300 (-) Transcript_9928:678-1577(-)|eukprot:15360539-Ditylum_brightwellii.AAC.1
MTEYSVSELRELVRRNKFNFVACALELNRLCHSNKEYLANGGCVGYSPDDIRIAFATKKRLALCKEKEEHVLSSSVVGQVPNRQNNTLANVASLTFAALDDTNIDKIERSHQQRIDAAFWKASKSFVFDRQSAKEIICYTSALHLSQNYNHNLPERSRQKEDAKEKIIMEQRERLRNRFNHDSEDNEGEDPFGASFSTPVPNKECLPRRHDKKNPILLIDKDSAADIDDILDSLEVQNENLPPPEVEDDEDDLDLALWIEKHLKKSQEQDDLPDPPPILKTTNDLRYSQTLYPPSLSEY